MIKLAWKVKIKGISSLQLTTVIFRSAGSELQRSIRPRVRTRIISRKLLRGKKSKRVRPFLSSQLNGSTGHLLDKLPFSLDRGVFSGKLPNIEPIRAESSIIASTSSTSPTVSGTNIQHLQLQMERRLSQKLSNGISIARPPVVNTDKSDKQDVIQNLPLTRNDEIPSQIDQTNSPSFLNSSTEITLSSFDNKPSNIPHDTTVFIDAHHVQLSSDAILATKEAKKEISSSLTVEALNNQAPNSLQQELQENTLFDDADSEILRKSSIPFNWSAFNNLGKTIIEFKKRPY